VRDASLRGGTNSSGVSAQVCYFPKLTILGQGHGSASEQSLSDTNEPREGFVLACKIHAARRRENTVTQVYGQTRPELWGFR
jgi:hypothetical protein